MSSENEKDRDNRFIPGRPDVTNTIEEIKELYKLSTMVVGWYSHHPGQVRGPFCRWFEVTDVAPEYQKYVASKADDARYAAAAMNNTPHLIDRIEELESQLSDMTELLTGQCKLHIGTIKEFSNLKTQLAIAIEALEFYKTAFDKKLTSSMMGEYTPFNVDRGANAAKALDKIKELQNESSKGK